MVGDASHQSRHPGDIRGIGVLATAAEDHIVDDIGVQIGALENLR